MDYYNPNAISSLEEGDDQDSINEHASGFQEDFPMDSLGHVNPYFQDDGDIEMQTNGLRQRDPYMEGAKPRRTRALSTASSMQYSSEEEDPDDIVESAAIAASLRDPHSMLDLLPSRQLGSTLIVAHASKKWLKTRQSTRGTLSVKKGRHNSGTRVAVERIVNNEDMVDGSARSLIRRQNTIKAIPGSIETKRRIRDKVEKKKSKKDKSVSYFTMLSYNIGMSWQTVKNKLKDLKYSTNFWDGHIKKIEGNFGSGVTSYFLFLRWLLLLNIPVFLLSFSFATIPQLIYEPSPLYNTASFSVLDLFTGMGWFTDTELYYGYYTNETFTTNDKHYYDMPVAYLFTCGGYSLFLLVALLI
ncbi:uncharacterized protein LOC102810173, partial [Saccoglossus kowalevskii]|uniref:Transmembrane channel-like protein 7-like n=1 Tax=Saccoglossus kowalevskii TaxID=10224 RepID=A0ABM0MGG7_SACKO